MASSSNKRKFVNISNNNNHAINANGNGTFVCNVCRPPKLVERIPRHYRQDHMDQAEDPTECAFRESYNISVNQRIDQITEIHNTNLSLYRHNQIISGQEILNLSGNNASRYTRISSAFQQRGITIIEPICFNNNTNAIDNASCSNAERAENDSEQINARNVIESVCRNEDCDKGNVTHPDIADMDYDNSNYEDINVLQCQDSEPDLTVLDSSVNQLINLMYNNVTNIIDEGLSAYVIDTPLKYTGSSDILKRSGQYIQMLPSHSPALKLYAEYLLTNISTCGPRRSRIRASRLSRAAQYMFLVRKVIKQVKADMSFANERRILSMTLNVATAYCHKIRERYPNPETARSYVREVALFYSFLHEQSGAILNANETKSLKIIFNRLVHISNELQNPARFRQSEKMYNYSINHAQGHSFSDYYNLIYRAEVQFAIDKVLFKQVITGKDMHYIRGYCLAILLFRNCVRPEFPEQMTVFNYCNMKFEDPYYIIRLPTAKNNQKVFATLSKDEHVIFELYFDCIMDIYKGKHVFPCNINELPFFINRDGTPITHAGSRLSQWQIRNKIQIPPYLSVDCRTVATSLSSELLPYEDNPNEQLSLCLLLNHTIITRNRYYDILKRPRAVPMARNILDAIANHSGDGSFTFKKNEIAPNNQSRLSPQIHANINTISQEPISVSAQGTGNEGVASISTDDDINNSISVNYPHTSNSSIVDSVAQGKHTIVLLSADTSDHEWLMLDRSQKFPGIAIERKVPGLGDSIKATVSFKTGTPICDYQANFFSKIDHRKAQLLRRSSGLQEEAKLIDNYRMYVGNYVAEGHEPCLYPGGAERIGRLINHCSDKKHANVKARYKAIRLADGSVYPSIRFYVIRPIKPGDRLIYRYGSHAEMGKPIWGFHCFCSKYGGKGYCICPDCKGLNRAHPKDCPFLSDPDFICESQVGLLEGIPEEITTYQPEWLGVSGFMKYYSVNNKCQQLCYKDVSGYGNLCAVEALYNAMLVAGHNVAKFTVHQGLIHASANQRQELFNLEDLINFLLHYSASFVIIRSGSTDHQRAMASNYNEPTIKTPIDFYGCEGVPAHKIIGIIHLPNHYVFTVPDCVKDAITLPFSINISDAQSHKYPKRLYNELASMCSQLALDLARPENILIECVQSLMLEIKDKPWLTKLQRKFNSAKRARKS